MEREVGGGIGMGNTCKPMAVSFQCMTKSNTHTKKKMVFHGKKKKRICDRIRALALDGTINGAIMPLRKKKKNGASPVAQRVKNLSAMQETQEM